MTMWHCWRDRSLGDELSYGSSNPEPARACCKPSSRCRTTANPPTATRVLQNHLPLNEGRLTHAHHSKTACPFPAQLRSNDDDIRVSLERLLSLKAAIQVARRERRLRPKSRPRRADRPNAAALDRRNDIGGWQPSLPHRRSWTNCAGHSPPSELGVGGRTWRTRGFVLCTRS